ncbi:GNAT family N-acetyltransferase [Sporohalobacter salinus]|uniref:GNAT family N-acetyltransferase n=1 Tax=Sporohalobacter salinus TaxID=1494606 RepID=UPI00195F809D|nr:GNAT family N-acetyltransferase [Sporohalobacter salinus]MBM7622525.1 phosphinothricin acetyltransferase [Sporohalobacter salinus]
MKYIIDNMNFEDWEQVKEIYLEGIKTGNATFETEVPSWQEWNKAHASKCRLVARKRNKVLGWAALSPVSNRCVYSGIGEVSIYVKSEYREEGIGTNLLKRLIETSEKNGFWTLQASIFPENKSSLSLHKKFGFREVGIRKKIGRMKKGNWRDVILLERRSNKIGID